MISSPWGAITHSRSVERQVDGPHVEPPFQQREPAQPIARTARSAATDIDVPPARSTTSPTRRR